MFWLICVFFMCNMKVEFHRDAEFCWHTKYARNSDLFDQTLTISSSSYLSVCWPNWAVGLSELSCNLITGIIAECFSPLSKELVFSHNEMRFVNSLYHIRKAPGWWKGNLFVDEESWLLKWNRLQQFWKAPLAQWVDSCHVLVNIWQHSVYGGVIPLKSTGNSGTLY